MQVKFKDRVVMSKQNADQYNLMQRRKSGAHEVNDRFFKYPQLKPTGNHARLKGILVKTLTSNGCFKTYDSDGSLLLMSCLTTMNVLLQFGMYTNAEAQEQQGGSSLSDLLRVLIELLGTENEDHFTYDVFTAPIINAKL